MSRQSGFDKDMVNFLANLRCPYRTIRDWNLQTDDLTVKLRKYVPFPVHI
jgi:hypothetical protein